MAISPLHNHTHYSALDGLATPLQIADRCTAINVGACGCTDHDVVAGHVDFFTTLIDRQLKPILGIETYQAPESRFITDGRKDANGIKINNFHLILLAMNNTGLRNLWAMNTEAHKTGHYYVGRVDWELLTKYNEGIVATSACALGLIQQALAGNSKAGDPEELAMKFLSIFKDRFYLELSTYPEDWQEAVNVSTVALAKTFNVPVVYANDAHYASPEQYDLHELILKMRPGLTPDDGMGHKPDLYIMDETEVRAHLAYLPTSVVDEALSNSTLIANQSEVSLPEFRKRVPIFVPDKQYKNSKDMFFELATEGYERKIVNRLGDSSQVDSLYLPRFEEEMKTIYQADLIDYFLIVRDFINFAHRKGIAVGPGRGSVGGSLIAYLLDITEVDPIRFGLIFERFYNVGREKSLPDIDIDFSTHGREQVKQYIDSKYGTPYVAELPNVLTMQGRAAIKKLGIAMKIPPNETEKISKIIENAIESGLQPDWQMIWDRCGDKLAPFVLKYPDLFVKAEELHKHIFAYGVHASGLVIADEPLAENYPLKWHAKDKKMVAQWDYRTAEKFGYMKGDLLGLRNLDTLEELNNILKEQGKKPIIYTDLHDMDHPDEMYQMLEQGKTVGIFQIEDGTTAKNLCREIKPRSIEELALIIALNRPGPLIAGADKKYLAGRNGTPVTYLHPLVEKVTQETYGEFIYQEQVINFFRELGYDLKEADNMRKIIGKKDRESMQKEMNKYLDLARPQLGDALAQRIWTAIQNFSKYAFNKAHSIAYAILLLRTLYAKWSYPKEFILAGLRTVEKKERYRYIQEAQRLQIPVLSPRLNESDVNATITEYGICYGFNDVKGVGKGPARFLVKHAPFADWEDVLTKSQIEEYKDILPSGIKRVAINKGHIERLRSLEEFTGDGLLAVQEELLGVALSDDSATILEDYKEEIEAECWPLDAIDEPGEYTIAGIIKEIKERKTKNGNPMAIIKLVNGDAEKDIMVWNSELERLRFIWKRRNAVVAQVRTNDRGTSILKAKVLYRK